MIRQARAKNKDAIVVAMGCFTQIRNNDNQIMDFVDVVIGNKDKSKVVDLTEDYIKNKQKIAKIEDINEADFDDMEISYFNTRTRALVKIEDGCENFCSYCIIPYTRGKVRSKKPERVLKEVNTLVANGYKEIVLTGIHTGHYGSDLDNYDFSDLLEDLDKIEDLERIRISSIEIVELNDKFLNILKKSKKIVNHIHIPMQAGSDHVLKLMNRRYDKEYFMNKVKEIRSLRKDISLSTDVIVGFPGETEEDFNETMEFCKEIGFSKIHVFPYSDRNGTVASTMKDHIDRMIIKDRARKLITLSNELEKEYFEKFIDREEDVLIEEYKDGYFHGFTSNYIPVKLKGNYEINSLINIKLTKENINFDLNQ